MGIGVVAQILAEVDQDLAVPAGLILLNNGPGRNSLLRSMV